MNTAQDFIQAPGAVEIRKLILVSPSRNISINLRDYLVELNIYESMFSPGITGSITLADNRNLVKDIPILGEELLVVELVTPSFDDTISIYKTFRIFGLHEKNYAKDGNSLLYNLNFCSIELFKDINNKIFRSFSGKPSDIVLQIFDEYLRTNRNVNVEDKRIEDALTNLIILNESSNVIRFVSPGWSPVQCINWVASKSLAKGEKASDFLFWETTKGFFFGSSDFLTRNVEKLSVGNYILSSAAVGSIDGRDPTREMFTIKSLKVDNSFDQLNNTASGYLASRVIDLNLFNKKFEFVDYDHTLKYFEYNHTSDTETLPFFDIGISTNPASFSKINYSIPNLYNMKNNFSEVEKYIYSNRRSNLLETQNFRMTATIFGRTDIEVGNYINIQLPDVFPTFPEDITNSDKKRDELYSGYYLITSLNHKINAINGGNHIITTNLSKDGLAGKISYDTTK